MGNKLAGTAEYEDLTDDDGYDGGEDDKTTGKEVKKTMPKQEAPAMTQLATRVNAELFRKIKIHCVQNDLTVMEFVGEALEGQLKKSKK